MSNNVIDIRQLNNTQLSSFVTAIAGGLDFILSGSIGGGGGGGGGVTGDYYPNSNPSGFIPSGALSLYLTQSAFNAATGGFYPASNPNAYIGSGALAGYATTSSLSAYATTSSLSAYATNSSVDFSLAVLQGQLNLLTAATGGYYPRTNPTGYITSAGLSSYATLTSLASTGSNLQSQITLLSGATGNYYPRTNPSGYLRSIPSDVVRTTGDQNIFGHKSYYDTTQIFGTFMCDIVSNASNSSALNVANGLIIDSFGFTSLDWTNRNLSDPSSVPSINWASRYLYDNNGNIAEDWFNRTLNDSSSVTNLNWETKTLSNSWNVDFLAAAGLTSSLNGYSYDLNNGQILQTGGLIINFSTKSLSNGWSLGDATGSLYPASNPNGYITSSALSTYATTASLISSGNFLQGNILSLQAQTGNYYPRTNPSGYLQNADLLRVTGQGPSATGFDWSAGSSFNYNLSAVTALGFSNTRNGQSVIVSTYTTGNFTGSSWPATVKWPGGITPAFSSGSVLTGKYDVWNFTQINGVIFGNYSLNYY